MGSQTAYQPHKVVVPVLVGPGFEVDQADSLVAGLFGPVDSRSAEIPFTFTHYYDREMGSPITRILYSVRELVDPSELGGLKLLSNAEETRTAAPGGRRVINIDPGLLSLTRLILATTKPSAHRIPIGQGMHAEVTLLFQNGAFRPLEWTYPDFRDPAYREWLLSVRQEYHRQLKEMDPGSNWRL